MIFSIETDRGQFLVDAPDEIGARKFIREEYGRSEIIRKVSTEKSDIGWAKSMGAKVHDSRNNT